MAQSFGTELRRRRTEAGLSLAKFATLVHYSKSHLSKVETGAKPPSVDLARRCDAVLSCRGELASLVVPEPGDESAPSGAAPDQIWLLGLGNDGASHFSAVSPGQVRAAGIAGLSAWAGRLDPPRGGGADEATVASMRVVFDEIRKLGQTVSAVTLLPVLATHTHLLQTLATGAATSVRDAALVLAARFAEFAGWMAQENGDDTAAGWWTDHAVELAGAGSDSEMAAYAHVRRALITLYRHDAISTVALAQRAQGSRCSARVRGLAAQREAQGHAIAGDDAACFRALDRATTLLQAPAEVDSGPMIGTQHAPDPTAFATAWCLFDLGRPAQAADILTNELTRIPPHAFRIRARYGARLALAHAGNGEVEQACVAAEPVLGTHDQVDSATVRLELRSLARTLNRWHTDPHVRRIMPRLNAALHVTR